MTYVYTLANGKELCRSDSPVTFSGDFPQFQAIEPKTAGTRKAPKKAEPKED